MKIVKLPTVIYNHFLTTWDAFSLQKALIYELNVIILSKNIFNTTLTAFLCN
jgi:hypothetical protein